MGRIQRKYDKEAIAETNGNCIYSIRFFVKYVRFICFVVFAVDVLANLAFCKLFLESKSKILAFILWKNKYKMRSQFLARKIHKQEKKNNLFEPNLSIEII
jgi:hypothetical protein